MTGVLKKGALFLIAAVFCMGIISPAMAGDKEDVAALKAQVADLQAQVKTLEARQQPAAGPAMAVPTAPVQAVVYDQWDPFAEMEGMQQQMNALMAHQAMMPGSMGTARAFVPDHDIKETDKAYIVTFDMPGMDKSKIDVEVKDGVLVVSGERSSESTENSKDKYYRQQRSFGYFSRTIPLPKDAKADSVQAAYENGVLTVTVEKTGAAKPAGQKVTVR